MGDIKKLLAALVAAQRETALATVVLAENVAALRESLLAAATERDENLTRRIEAVRPLLEAAVTSKMGSK